MLRGLQYHDYHCESELTTHGYTPCRCEERMNSDIIKTKHVKAAREHWTTCERFIKIDDNRIIYDSLARCTCGAPSNEFVDDGSAASQLDDRHPVRVTHQLELDVRTAVNRAHVHDLPRQHQPQAVMKALSESGYRATVQW